MPIFVPRMKHRIGLFLRTYLFWILFFIIGRWLFLIYHFDKTAALTFREIATINFLGLRMDAAMAGYWTIPTALLLTASTLWIDKGIRTAQLIITIILLLLSCFIVIGDLELYKHWGFRMDTTPLMYLGSEGAGSVSVWVVIKLILLFIVLFTVSYLVYKKLVLAHFKKLTAISLKWSPLILLIGGLLFIPIRSSFDVAPLNTGVVYFHKTNAFANHSGINVVWNFFRSLSYYDRVKYPSHFYEPDEAEELLKEMTDTKDNPLSLLKEKTPNILLIILESFTSKIIEPLGGRAGITPNLNQLIKEGVLFDHFYASGDRTDKGIISILSSYPAQPQTSIIKYPNKTQSLPYLPAELEKFGYHPTFVYGGDIGFANMESYLTLAGFTHITEDDDFESELINSKWGVHDHFVFQRLLQETDSASHPFFKTLLTLSSHEPFDVPVATPFVKGNDEASLFLNACHYTDSSLGVFIQEAKTKPWWNTTLIVVTADHGHRFPNQDELKEKERFQIPLLLLGGALTKTDTVIHTVGSQVDLATTLLGQAGENKKVFPFGKNLLAPDVKSFAIYSFHNGFGYVDDQNEFIYDFDFKNYIKQTGSEEKKKWGEAYTQVLFTDYNKR
jgi:phosphoglycerol transferase MdoB-like AlkP superfamily enzyme